MPIILFTLLRPFVQWLVTITVTTVIADLVAELLKRIVAGVAEHYNIPETDAKVVVSNKLIDIAALLGVGTGVLYTKLGIKATDYLGLKAGSVVKKKLSTTAEVKVSAKDFIASSQKSAGSIIWGKLKAVGSLNWLMLFMVAQGIGDWFFFARPQLQKTLRDITGVEDLTLPGGKEAPPGFSDTEWNGYASGLEAAGIRGINNPQKNATFVYSRDALSQIATWQFGELALAGKSTTATALQKAIAPFLIGGATKTQAAESLPAAVASAATYTPVKVFTGIVSQGTLGASQPFSAREDDLINSAAELRDVAQTNAASFLASLPGRIVYELKIANSVIDASGNKRVGATQKVQIGTLKSGEPRYKYVTNKWAVISLYYSRREGTRTKIADITLGPTDVAQFNPSSGDLASIGNALAGIVSTSSLGEIQQVVSAQPLVVKTLDAAAPFDTSRSYNIEAKIPGDTGYRFYKREISGKTEYYAMPWAGNIPYGFTETTEQEYRAATRDTKDYTNSGYKFVGGVITQDPTVRPSPLNGSPEGDAIEASAAIAKRKAGAANLKEFYDAMSLPVPGLSERALMYQSLGLGASSLYTGTVEQNTKLLLTLQGKS